MQRVVLTLAVGIIATMCGGQTARALPPYNKEWMAKYVSGNPNKKFVDAVAAVGKTSTAASCNVCHKGTTKKDRNEYGIAVGQYLDKATYTGMIKNGVPDAAKSKWIREGLGKAAGDLSSDGQQTYGELIKAGKLPGEP